MRVFASCYLLQGEKKHIPIMSFKIKRKFKLDIKTRLQLLTFGLRFDKRRNIF